MTPWEWEAPEGTTDGATRAPAAHLVRALRHQGFAVARLGTGTSRRQLKAANQAGARAAVLVHPEGEVTVRDMVDGHQVVLHRQHRLEEVLPGRVGEALRGQGVPQHGAGDT